MFYPIWVDDSVYDLFSGSLLMHTLQNKIQTQVSYTTMLFDIKYSLALQQPLKSCNTNNGLDLLIRIAYAEFRTQYPSCNS